MLGPYKVKLPLNTPEYWRQIELIQKNEKKDDFIQTNFMGLKLYFNDLNYLNVPIKMYYAVGGIQGNFLIRQYEYYNGKVNIVANQGDIVIDGGGCFGDTALYFSNLVRKSGEVHSFEFIPDNIAIWKRNIELNPRLAESIFLVSHPIWSSSNVELFYKINGPGSTVSFENFSGNDGISNTITIDDYSEKLDLRSVDFIKLDIEGAELNALKGAVTTISKFKPKLAIALYHNTKDFESIPRFLNDLGLGYKFYLSHATIHSEETMLFAKVND